MLTFRYSSFHSEGIAGRVPTDFIAFSAELSSNFIPEECFTFTLSIVPFLLSVKQIVTYVPPFGIIYSQIGRASCRERV